MEQKDTTFRVMTAAYFTVLKGLHYLLEAWSRLDIPDRELLIVGGWGQAPKEYVEKMRAIINADPTIRWIGNVPYDHLPNVYREADLFVFPSLSEGFGKVTLEAMSCGLPVITTENARGIVEDGVTGYVVPIRDSTAIKEKIELFYNTKFDVLKRMGAAAKKKAGVAFTHPHQKEVISRESLLQRVRHSIGSVGIWCEEWLNHGVHSSPKH